MGLETNFSITMLLIVAIVRVIAIFIVSAVRGLTDFIEFIAIARELRAITIKLAIDID